MEDKKKIIIDGVDVSACISFNKCNGKNLCCYDDTREDKIPFANFCVENKDCYFKQHSRKTAECEKYEQALDEIEQHFEYRCKKCREEYELYASCDVCWKKQILNIINKAKDGK